MSTHDLRGDRLVPGSRVTGESFLDDWISYRGLLPQSDRSANGELAGFLRSLLEAAARLTARDRELLRAIDNAGSIYAAARVLAPEKAESLEVYMRRRLHRFRKIAVEFLQSTPLPSPESLQGPRSPKILERGELSLRGSLRS